MRLYNTLTGKKEEFKPINSDEVKIYACGPTVYNYIHIGNARPICVFDILRRYMEYIGYKVTFVQNFTDIDDKIIKKAIEEKSDYKTVSENYIKEYKKDAGGLNVKEATIHPKATENIDSIINMISKLIEDNFAYVADNGDVYFRPKNFSDYGKLSHQPIEELQAGARIGIGEEKENALDFALWKSAKPGEPSWDSPWGKGRPGWHIECSAMAGRYLGKTIDIHCGGQDLIFPHHENEIAQSECCNKVNFANYWLHNGYINVDSKKMSKSLNNFFTVRDVAQKYGYEPIRYLMIASHYRSPINYSKEIMEQCKSALERIYNCRENLDFAFENAQDNSSEDVEVQNKINEYKSKFIEAMDDDLNTADALAVIFELIKDINKNMLGADKNNKKDIKKIISIFDELAGVLGILYNRKSKTNDDEIENLIKLRNEARKNRDWKTADEIRNKLNEMNVVIEDTPQGVKWTIKRS